MRAKKGAKVCKKKKGKEMLREGGGGAKEAGGKGICQKLSNDRAKYYRSKFELWWVKPKLLPGMVDKLRGLQSMGKNENLEIRGQLLHPIYVLLKSWIPQNSANLISQINSGKQNYVTCVFQRLSFDQSRLMSMCIAQLLRCVMTACVCDVMTESADTAIVGSLNNIKYMN